LLYNIILLPISAGVLYPTYHIALVPMLAGGAMALSSVSIVLSSLLLLLYTPPRLLGATYPVLRDIVVVDPEGPRNSIPLNICNCPTSLAPILFDEGRSLSRTVRWAMHSVRKRFTPYYSLLSPGSSTDSDEEPISYIIPEIGSEMDLENCVLNDFSLSDVERFLRCPVPLNYSDDEEMTDFVAVDRTGLFMNDTGQQRSKLLSLSLLRNRNPAKSMNSLAVHGCCCNKSNCRCGPQCQCGTRR
jgi:hypothetical protein